MTANKNSTERRHEVLLDVARMLSRANDLEELLDNILDRSREVMDCEVCSILLPEAPGGDLRIRSTLDSGTSEPVLVPKGKGIAGDVFVTKKTVNIRDARRDPRHFTRAGDQSGLVTHAMITIPLLEGDHCLGVMQAINPVHDECFDGEDESIFETFGSLVAITLMRLDAHRRAILETQAREQLATATEIQRSFLPPSKVDIGAIRVEAFYEPASEVGGDFYFWHELERKMILLGIGDVCGKGLPAALDMARGTTLIASMAHACDTMGLESWVCALNERLCNVMSPGRFITAAFMLVDQNRRRVHSCIAGIPTPLVFDGSGWRELDTPGNPPLGISSSVRFHHKNFPLVSGQSWLILSDGILEAQNREGEYFEDQALAASLEGFAAARNSTDSVLATLANDWKRFAKNASYQDDATILAITDSTGQPPVEFAFGCKPETLKQAREFIETWVAYCGFCDRTAGLIVLACDEVFSNICKHAYCMLEGPAICRIRSGNSRMMIRIEHQGEGISNAEVEANTLPLPMDRAGGLGLHVLREVFDEMDFQTEGGRSVIELVKALE